MANNLTRAGMPRDMTRFDPFQDMEELFREMSLSPSWRNRDTSSSIRLDISEDEKNYTVKADLPGVKKEDIKISIEGNRVMVSAEIKQEKEVREKDMLRSERYVGQQYRSFTLPQDVDDANVQAKYENGVLQLSLPKKNVEGRKQITIQ
jgi:HSP20 family protein